MSILRPQSGLPFPNARPAIIPPLRDSTLKHMKSLLIIAVLSVATFLTGCRTVGVVHHRGPSYVRSGYYHSSRPYYYGSSRRVYGDRYYGRSYRSSRYDRGYRSNYYRSGYRTGYDRDRSYYRGGRSTRLIIR